MMGGTAEMNEHPQTGKVKGVKGTSPSQLQWLGQDAVEIRRLIDTALPSFAEQLGDATDPNRHAKYLVVADLTWRIWYLAMSIHILLEEEVYAPAVVLA